MPCLTSSSTFVVKSFFVVLNDKTNRGVVYYYQSQTWLRSSCSVLYGHYGFRMEQPVKCALNHELAFVLTLSPHPQAPWHVLLNALLVLCSRVLLCTVMTVVGFAVSLFPACLDLSESILFRLPCRVLFNAKAWTEIYGVGGDDAGASSLALRWLLDHVERLFKSGIIN